MLKQVGLASIILIIAGWRFLYVRDFLSGRLNYEWFTTVISSHDVLLITYLFGIGAAGIITLLTLKKRFIRR